ncbi:hypothetical protein SNE40_008511 [Patella caerulea]|uniref:sphingomyelin phosphodiesterase n=2 Tax=Patella caerulea TaxID=87958 RepID=A0AAN8JZ03_PATCE
MLHRREFPSPLLAWLFQFSVILFKPFWSCLSALVSICIATTFERRRVWKLFFKRSLLISPLLALCLLFLPFAIVGFIIRCILYIYRNPYRLSIKHTSFNVQSCKKINEYGVATLNFCLLPEFLSRLNNLSDTHSRAKEIGKRIILDQMFYGQRNDVNDNEEIQLSLRHYINNNPPAVMTGITVHFPNLEFLCIQEVWQSNYSDLLVEELHKIYPYVIRDVGKYGHGSNYFLLNSGLMFASKYEILDVDFKYFGTSCNQCVYAGKGLLMIKVLLWYEDIRTEKAVVGYLYSTQLQAYQGKVEVNDKQLDDIVKWTKEFRETTKRENDVIAFDILSGDFNFDNISPGDKNVREHELFDVYRDEGRQSPGTDHHWTVGTEMRQHYLYEDEVSTPEGLKKCLESPLLRQQFIVDADIEEASLDTIVYALPKTEISPCGGKRRIDLILYHVDYPVIPTRYNFVTRLTRLTDHIPVTMNFKLPTSFD